MGDASPPQKAPRGLYGQRPSASGEASRRRQIERDWAMSPRERMLTALRLGNQLRRIAPEVAEREARRKPEP